LVSEPGSAKKIDKKSENGSEQEVSTTIQKDHSTDHSVSCIFCVLLAKYFRLCDDFPIVFIIACNGFGMDFLQCTVSQLFFSCTPKKIFSDLAPPTIHNQELAFKR